MKDDVKAILRFKFKSWRLCFGIFFASFIISCITGTILYRGARLEPLTSVYGYFLSAIDTGFKAAFSVFLVFLAPFFLLYVAGPTVYAPLTSALTVVATGLFNGAETAYLMGRGRLALSLFELIFSTAVSYLLILWATLVTLSAVRLFTDTKKGSRPELFTGSLFNVGDFRGIFNFRYIFTYTGFYVLLSLGTLLLTLLRALSTSLF